MLTKLQRVRNSEILGERSITAWGRALAGALALIGACLGVAQAEVITEFSTDITAGAQPLAITAGPDGNLWFAEFNIGRIGRITPLGAVTVFSADITAGAGPFGITAGPDGNLWFAEYNISRIGRITPLGIVTEFSTNITPGAGPDGITLGSDGNLWFTELDGNRIGKVTVQSTVTVTRAGSGSGHVTGSDGIINCGATCAHTYPDGTVLTLSAKANAESVFTGWLGACSGTGLCHLTINTAVVVSATFASATIGTRILDIDDNGSYDALTDGLMVIRYLFGLTDTSVTNGAMAADALRSDPNQTYQADVRPLLDVDGNGQADTSTDGLLIIRHLLGLRGNALISGSLGIGATRTSAVDVTTYLQGLTP